MNRHWASDLIGKRWKNGGYGPTEFDCWGLYWYVAKTYFLKEVPKFLGVDALNVADVRTAATNALNTGDWIKLDRPLNGCVVAIGPLSLVEHVGVYLDIDNGVILHCMPKAGVLCQKEATITNHGVKVLGYYIHKTWR